MNRNSKKVMRRISFLLSLLVTFQSIFGGTNISFAQTVPEKALDEVSDSGEESQVESIASATPQTTPTAVEETEPPVHAEDLSVSYNMSLTEDTVVNNLNISNNYLNLAGYKLTVLGNITLNGGFLNVNSGNVICYGDCKVANNAYIRMENQDDYLKVCGDFTTNSYRFNTITAGALEIQGDFNQINRSGNDIL